MSDAARTEMVVTGLILLLLVLAALLAFSTTWYWFRTSPRRRHDQLAWHEPVDDLDAGSDWPPGDELELAEGP